MKGLHSWGRATAPAVPKIKACPSTRGLSAEDRCLNCAHERDLQGRSGNGSPNGCSE